MHLYIWVSLITSLGATIQAGSKPHEAREAKESGLSCRKIVSMGRDRFTEAYKERRPHAKKRTAESIYAECKRKDNDARATKLPGLAAADISELRRILTDLQTAAFRMANARSTQMELFQDFEAHSSAEREDTCGKVIDIFSKSNPLNTTSRANAAE